MNSYNCTIQDYSNFPMNQTGNIVLSSDNKNFQLTSDVGMSNTNLDTSHANTTSPSPKNTIFEFYLSLPNDTRIYHITYRELDSLEIGQLLNNRNDLSHIPHYQFQHHYNVQSLIQQRIVQPPIDHKQNIVQQQSFNTMNVRPIFQKHSDNNDNNAYDATDATLIPPNGTILEDISGYNGV